MDGCLLSAQVSRKHLSYPRGGAWSNHRAQSPNPAHRPRRIVRRVAR